MTNSSISKGKLISIGGLLTSITVIFQSSPVFLPLIGMVLSPFSTLPLALGTILDIPLGLCIYFSSTIILLLISVEEALIFTFTSGILGLTIGIFLYRKGIIKSILFSSIGLTIGIVLLTFVIGIFQFKTVISLVPVIAIILGLLIFSFIYSFIWNIGFRKFINYLVKIKVINI